MASTLSNWTFIGKALVLPTFFLILLLNSVSAFVGGDNYNYYIVQGNTSSGSSNESLWENVSGVATYDGNISVDYYYGDASYMSGIPSSGDDVSNLGNKPIIQTVATSQTNHLGNTYMRGAKIRSIGGDGYYTLGATDDVGHLYFENAVDHSGKLVSMVFNLTDESIHIQNPLIIDTSALGLDPDDPIIYIDDGSSIASFTAGLMSIDSVNIVDIIGGSPTITYDTINSTTGIFISIGDSTRLGTITGTAYFSDATFCGPPFNRILGVGTKFTEELQIGETITVKGNDFYIQDIISDTEIEHSEFHFAIDCIPDIINLDSIQHQFVITNEGRISSDLTPNKTGRFNLGVNISRWDVVYAEELNSNHINTATYDLLMPVDAYTNMGDASNRFRNVYFGGSDQNSLTLSGNNIESWDAVNKSYSSLWIDNSEVTYSNRSIEINGSVTLNQSLVTFSQLSTTSHIMEVSGTNGVIVRGDCGFISDPVNRFLCGSPFFLTGNLGELYVGGEGNLMVGLLGSSSGTFNNNITGMGNLGFGINVVGNTIIEGFGNLFWGKGQFNISGNGNAVFGDRMIVSGNSNLVGGSLHTVTGNSNTVGGANNLVTTDYATALGYNNKVSGATGVAIGRNNDLRGIYGGAIGFQNNISGSQSYGIGRNVKNDDANTITIGNGDNSQDNRDIIITETEIIINKTLYVSNITLTNLVEDDLRFPANVIKVQGASNIPEITIFGLGFDDNTMEQAYIIAQMPHSRKDGSDVEPHFHWHSDDDTSGDVVWCLEYRWANIQGSFSSPSTVCTVDSSVGDAEVHLMTIEDIDLDGTGYNYSSIIKGRIYRNASDSRDTYVGDAHLLEFDIHYYMDKLGN